MTRESYEKITGILRGHPRRIRLVCLFNHTLTGFIFVLYPAFLLLLFLEGSTFFLRALPSRHVFSVFIIAATIFYVHPSAGILLGLLGVVLAVLRVIGGVHEPRDVIAGALAGILCGVLGYYVL